MNLGLIVALAAVGQASGSGWQPSDWPKSQVAPSQYSAPASEVSPSAAARYGTPQYAQPATTPQGNYDYPGQTSWPAAQPTPQPVATQQDSQYTSQQQYNAANTQPTWPNAAAQPRTADTRSTATGNAYGTPQQPATYWNQQPRAAGDQPQLLAPQNSTNAQQYWQQAPQDAWGSSRLANTLREGQQQVADSKAALAAEYQAQIDDRWSFYSDFYRQPNPQLPTLPAQPQQQPSQPQYQYQGGAAVVDQSNPYGNNYTQPIYSQPNQSSQLTYAQQTQTQPKTAQPNYNQPNYSQPTYDQQRGGSGTSVVQQPSGWPNNVYQPPSQFQPQPSNPIGSGAATIADSRGSMTLQPPLNSTLPAGGETRNGVYTGSQPAANEAAAAPRFNNGQTAWNNDNAGTIGKSGWDNGGAGQPRVDSTSALNPPPVVGSTGLKSNFPTLSSGATTSKPKSNLLSSLTPKSSSQSNPSLYKQPPGSGKGGSGLFTSASLGQTSEDAHDGHDHVGGDGQQPWGVLVASLFGLFFSVGANLYLGWIAFESHFRYRRLLIEGDEVDDRETRRRRD